MRVFVTGAAGFVGSKVVEELKNAGYEVIGLARSEANEKDLAAAGVQVHRGDVQDLESLRQGVSKSDAVIHCAFVHDFTNFVASCEIDRRAIEAMGAALTGSSRPFIVTAGTGSSGVPGRLVTENDPGIPASVFPRGATEEAVNAVAARGVRTMVVRLPQVHDPEKQGLITRLVALAHEKKVSAYVGDGQNRWAAAPRVAAAQLYRLVLEKGSPGARYHAVAEEGVSLKDIADAVAKRVRVPVVVKSPDEAPAYFGFLAAMISRDLSASSAQTQKQLGWRPTGPSLIEDIVAG